MRLCNIDDCPKLHEARGWCNKHYRRWLKHGDPTHLEKRGGFQGVRLAFKQPMDAWEQRRVKRLLSQGMSYRAIERSTGIGYMTVHRFVKKERAA